MTQSRRERTTDVLRGVAALLVVLTHTSVDFATLPSWTHPVGWVFRAGGTGVTLFLVISGYSIAGRWGTRRNHDGSFPLGAFWRRRFLRLYPTFWVAAAVSLALLVVADGWPSVAHRPRPWLWSSGQVPVVVQLLGYVTVVTANVVPLAHMGRAWSLALEEQLYAAYSLLQRRRRAVSPTRLLAVAVVVDVLYRTAVFLSHANWGAPSSRPVPASELFLTFQVPAMAVPWCAGWVVAEVRAGRAQLPRLLTSVPAGLVLLAAGVVLHGHGGPVLSLPAGRVLAPVDLVLDLVFVAGFVALLAGGFGSRATAGLLAAPARFLAWVGTWAYSLYLLHPPLLRLVDVHSGLPLVPRVLAGWALALGGSWLLWVLVERRWVERAAAVPVPGRQPASPGSVTAAS